MRYTCYCCPPRKTPLLIVCAGMGNMWSKHKKNTNPRFNYDGVLLWEIGDRSMLNMLEQHVYFLSFVWMLAIFVEAQLAGALGLVAGGGVSPTGWAFEQRNIFRIEPTL